MDSNAKSKFEVTRGWKRDKPGTPEEQIRKTGTTRGPGNRYRRHAEETDEPIKTEGPTQD